MNIKDMDLNLLWILEALFAERNVTRAARRVGLSQPAFSNALNRLRKTFGDPLFLRTTEGMVPTTRAQALADPLAEALRSLGGVLGPPPSFVPAKAANNFCLATTDYAEWLCLPPLYRALATEAPHARLEVRSLTESIPQRALALGEIDLAIGYFTQVPASLYQRVLFEDAFVCVVRNDHPCLAKGLDAKAYAALKHVVVAPWGGMLGMVDSLLGKRGLKREIQLSTPHFLVAPLLVSQSDAVVTLPRRIAESLARTMPLTCLEHPLALTPLTIALLWHARAHRDPAQQWLRARMVELAKA